MARPKGLPKTGGRKPGAQNKAKRENIRAIIESGLSPLDYMIQIMRDAEMPLDKRLDAAKSAAPYVHPRLAAVEHSTDPDNPLQVTNRIEFAVVDPNPTG